MKMGDVIPVSDRFRVLRSKIKVMLPKGENIFVHFDFSQMPTISVNFDDCLVLKARLI